MKKILAIPGSNFPPSTAHHLLQYIQATFNTFEIEIFEDLPNIPAFHPGLPEDEIPAIVQQLKQQIAEADGLLFVSPEYVFSLPGSLKNLIEWLVGSTVLSTKPTAFIIAAASGQAAFDSLSLILTTLECMIPDESKGLIQGAKGKIKNSFEITNEQTRETIASVITSLGQCMAHSRKTATKYDHQ